MYEELSQVFPGYTHFYIVQGLMMAEAMERAARLTGDDGMILNHANQVIFAVKHDIGQGAKDISWLNPVPGQPVDVE